MYLQSNPRDMNKAPTILFALMMMTVSLAGCFGGDEGDTNDETPIVWKGPDWQYISDDNLKMVKKIFTPSDLTAVGQTLYFSADYGKELWKSDGTANGTVMVSQIGHHSQLAAVGNTLYFSGGEPSDQELWKTDGTANGTVRVKDIYTGSEGSNPTELTAVGNTLYFIATDGTNGNRLWKSNGTANGTVMVSQIGHHSLTVVGNTLYFFSGGRLLKTDEANGTETISQFDQFQPHPKGKISVVNNTLYFLSTHLDREELWKTNGTDNGTVMVKRFGMGSATYGDASHTHNSLTAVGNTLYIGLITKEELWASDGTSSGTVWLKDIYNIDFDDTNYFTAVDNILYFRANDGTYGIELWKSDGTVSGTVMVTVFPSTAKSDPNYLTAIGNTLYFSIYDGNIEGLCKSDGTTNGTVMFNISFPQELTAVGNTLYFSANRSELWAYNGASTEVTYS
jgi:ELWxxDGT repeat protein